MSTTTRTPASTGALVLASVVLAAGAAGSAGSPARGDSHEGDRIVRQARAYVGDPREQRYRDQFWQNQHIHDSWNRCHLGENAPRPRGCDGTSLTPRG
jgi:hypothetical protein